MKVRKSIVGSAVALFSLVAAAQGIPEKQLMLSIEAQPMVDALNSWAQQTGWQLIVPEDKSTSLLAAPSVKGRFTAREALRELLEGTSLAYELVDERTVVIRERRTTRLQGAALPDSAQGKKFMQVAAAQTDSGRPAAGATQSDEHRLASADRRELDRRKSLGVAEEVIVTAQKREERLIDVPISIVALGADDLQNRKINNIDDMQAAVPGLTIIGTGGFQRRIMLRGIGNTFGGSSLIGMYLDEAAVTPPGPASELDLRTYDLARVEVLRGPQGTLYGAGSVGGTVRFITEDPKLDGFAARADVAASFTEDGEPNENVNALVNIPLVEDELGVRIAGTYDRQGGWMDQPALNKEDINGQEVFHVRAKALWRPSQVFTVNAMTVVHRNDGTLGSKGEDADGNFSQAFGLPTTPSAQDDYDIYNLTLTYDLDSVRILSATSYIDQDKLAKDFGSFAQIAAPPAPRRRFIYFMNGNENQTFTQELRFTSQGTSDLEWTTGAFYRRARSLNQLVYTADGLFPTRVFSDSTNRSESAAIFGDVSYQFTDQIKAGVGLRYFEDDQESRSGAAVGVPAVLGTQIEGTFDTLNPRVYLQYKWSDELNTYASAAKGFRSGGFNGLGRPNYGPESVWTYELGTKMSSASTGLSAEVALFYSDYTDYVVVGLVPTPPTGQLLTALSNAGKATIKGVELGLGWNPTQTLRLGFNGTYVQSEFYEINALNSAFAVGDPLDLIPEYSFTVSAEQELSLAGRPGFVRLDYGRQGESTYRNRNLVGPTPWYYGESDVIDTLNLNTGLQWNDSLSLGLFAENLLNERGYTSPFAVTDDIATRARPRTLGVKFSFSFE